ncbi:MAG: hypothetical protein J6K14_01010 [Clostridia bacterium]|nr:hypothetical protein [Clostridia bacterium]
MEYEKIILDLLMRVKELEEKVEQLSKEKKNNSKKQPGIAEIREYIIGLKQKAAEDGLPYIVLKANDIHKAMELKSRMPAVCSAMKQCMNMGDIVLHKTASGFSSTFEIQYTI